MICPVHSSLGERTPGAERGHVIGTLLSAGTAKPMYDMYRQTAHERGWEAGPDRFAYAVVVGVGHTRELSHSPTHPDTTRSRRMWRC